MWSGGQKRICAGARRSRGFNSRIGNAANDAWSTALFDGYGNPDVIFP
jgi:hypothetical protein